MKKNKKNTLKGKIVKTKSWRKFLNKITYLIVIFIMKSPNTQSIQNIMNIIHSYWLSNNIQNTQPIIKSIQEESELKVKIIYNRSFVEIKTQRKKTIKYLEKERL